MQLKKVRVITGGVPTCQKTTCGCFSCPPYNVHLKPGHCGVCAHNCHKSCGPLAALKKKLKTAKEERK